MLYRLFNSTQKMLKPLRNVWKIAKPSLDQAAIEFTDYKKQYRALAGFMDILERSTRRSEVRPFGITSTEVNGETVKVEEEIVLDKPFCNLLHFKKTKPSSANEPKVLIVAPISGHFATLLRDTAKMMIPYHDTYITEWKNARDVPVSKGNFGLDEYTSYLIEFIKKIGKKTHVMGVCQPVVQVMAVAAIMNKNNDTYMPASVIPLGGPIDPRANKTEVNELAERYSLEHFARTMLYRVPAGNLGEGRLVYPGFLQLLAFMAMNPDKHFNAHVKYHVDYINENKPAMEKHATFYDEYLTTMDMDATYFIETVEKIFQNYDLPRGTLTYKGEKIDLADIKDVALLVLEGENDDISAPGQCLAAYDLCKNLSPNMKDHYLQPGVGHYGIFSGSKWRNSVYPVLAEFIKKHN